MDFGWLKGAGTLIGGLGTVYGAHNQNEQFKKMNKMYEEDRLRATKKEDQTQANLDTAIDNVYGTKKKDNNTSFDLGV